MNIVFRVDASLDIGSGHVMRCLTLARSLRDRGAHSSFICRKHPGNLLEFIQDQGFDTAILPFPDSRPQESLSGNKSPLAHDSWLGTDWQSDVEQSTAAITDRRVDWLLVDHYGLDARWESAMRPFCERIMVIDDLADRNHDCDLLLDQNLVADLDHRYDGKIPAHCHRLLGPKFALLQNEYAKLHSEVQFRQGSIERVLVYFGAADSDNVTGMAIVALSRLKRSDISVELVVNSKHPFLRSILDHVNENPNIRLHTNLSTLAPLISNSDLAIGAAGATSWERCCLGLPALVVTIAENQRQVAEELHRQGLIEWIGYKGDVTVSKLKHHLEYLINSGLPQTWSKRCWEVLDGRGADRVASILTIGPQSKLKVRLAREEDESLILGWANDPDARRNSFSSSRISEKDHAKWFHERLIDVENCRIYVVESDAGLPIGQVRFDRLQSEWEISYALDLHFRGRKLGKRFLATALSHISKDNNASVFSGRVKEANEASCRVFEGLGFERLRTRQGVVTYLRHI